ncbi:MAG: PPK2 family polyphosphate kinase [Planctomycetota bacterium]|nr:PPK2 family polyphosphate kinase [Planctomycetota bacterium]
MTQPISFPPGHSIRLQDLAADDHGEVSREEAEALTEQYAAALDELTYRLYAENRRALLLVLQGMDTSGKDGAIRKALHEINPAGLRVISFKGPTDEESRHDFLWRIHKAVPAAGEVTVFNRSHYEDVGIVRVHKLVPEEIWKKRYDAINCFEQSLVDGGTTILKFYLHISRKEQKERLQARIDDPHKRWKFNKQDVEERKYWNEYTAAYDDALTRCNTAAAPWHVVPADRKWYRNFVISKIVHDTLKKMDPQFPPAEPGIEELLIK